jgi:nucleoside-diphosphate-sugar epimerase
MKALVTGGAGFIGSNLVKSLLEQGDEVIVLDNLSSGYQKNIHGLDIEFVEGDIRDSLLVDNIMKNVDAIYHLAASVGNKRSIDNPFLDADINVRGTLCILEAARKHFVKKIIVTSSAGIFGELKTLPIKENHPVEPRTPYACSKLYAEKIALAYADLYGIEAVCLRYFNVYGPHQRLDPYGNAIPIFVFKMLQNETISIFGDGEQTRDFVNVHDIVQANIKSAKTKGLIGAFNIASGIQVTVNQLVRDLIKISGLQPIVHYQDPRPGDVRHSLADISAAKMAFGYSPEVNLKEGLEEYVVWAKTELTVLRDGHCVASSG